MESNIVMDVSIQILVMQLLDEDREFQGSNLYEVVRRRLEIYDNEEEYNDNLDIDLDDQDGEVIIFSPSSSPIPSYTPPPYVSDDEFAFDNDDGWHISEEEEMVRVAEPVAAVNQIYDDVDTDPEDDEGSVCIV
ncbi:hypothetical protein Bhyg_07616, partial [Pseudolycoriella hygida]